MCEYVNEEWRSVVGWEDLYAVSDRGRVKRLARETKTRSGNIKILPEKIMTTNPGADGYVHIQLKHNGKRVVTKACRLVAEAFIPNPDGFVAVNHLNGDRSDCRVENLSWGPRGSYPRSNPTWSGPDEGETLEDILTEHTMPGEEWKDIDGYEGLYLVSSYGRVLSVPRPKGKSGILAAAIGSNGYQHVTLSKNGELKIGNIHQLVAKAFIENPNDDPIVNHKDEDKLNNFLDNLEWCSVQYNVTYGTGINRRAKARRSKVQHDDTYVVTKTKSDMTGRGYNHCKQVLRYDLDGNLLNSWPSIREASKATGVSESSISSACRRSNNHADGISCGYRWDFGGEIYAETT